VVRIRHHCILELSLFVLFSYILTGRNEKWSRLSWTSVSTIYHLCRCSQFYWWKKTTVASHWQTWSHNVL